jgi:hypothetical protein
MTCSKPCGWLGEWNQLYPHENLTTNNSQSKDKCSLMQNQQIQLLLLSSRKQRYKDSVTSAKSLGFLATRKSAN